MMQKKKRSPAKSRREGVRSAAPRGEKKKIHPLSGAETKETPLPDEFFFVLDLSR